MTSLAIVLLLTGMAFQSPESKGVPKDSVEVEAKGCLKGRVFTATEGPTAEGVTRGPDVTGRHFRVAGPREQMDLVKQHNGHLVEIVGIVRKVALSDDGIGIKVGGSTRVVIGAPGGDPTRRDARTTTPTMPTMDVTALRYLSDSCPIR